MALPADPLMPRTPFAQGFAGSSPRRGTHVCQIYTADEERMEAVLDFIRTHLSTGEHTYCISEQPTETLLEAFLGDLGLSLPPATPTGQLHTVLSRDFYLNQGVFDGQRLLNQWDALLAQARASGLAGPCAIAEVLAELRYLQGGTQLAIYESRLEEWMHQHLATIVCQYDARVFDACTLMNVLKVHPLVLAHARVAPNPFYAQPDCRKSH